MHNIILAIGTANIENKISADELTEFNSHSEIDYVTEISDNENVNPLNYNRLTELFRCDEANGSFAISEYSLNEFKKNALKRIIRNAQIGLKLHSFTIAFSDIKRILGQSDFGSLLIYDYDEYDIFTLDEWLLNSVTPDVRFKIFQVFDYHA